MVVLATDSFFMAMFFFLSGLFVWPGLGHKAPAIFLRSRLLRLGLPFAVAAFTVIPIAYYAISLRQHPEIGFYGFWYDRFGPLAEWPDLVCLGAVDVRSHREPIVPVVAAPARSDQPPFATRL
jgi:hypothetical protein